MNINRKKIGFLFLGLFIASLLIATTSVFAQTLPYVPLAPLPGTTQIGSNSDQQFVQVSKSLPDYLVAIFKLLIGVAAVLAVIEITVGGVQMMSSVDSESAYEAGKERIYQAILGLVLAIGAYLILYTVNPNTLNFNFNPSPIETTQQSGSSTSNNPTFGVFRKEIYCFLPNSTSTQAADIAPTRTTGDFRFQKGNQTQMDQARLDCAHSEPVLQYYASPVIPRDCPATTYFEEVRCSEYTAP